MKLLMADAPDNISAVSWRKKMKKGTITALITIIAAGAMLMMSTGNDSLASDVMKDGAELGSWTMDYKAALALAQKKDLPIMLNFTGSDWCGWCIRMDRNVFAKKEWPRWAAENLLLVTLDFPKGKGIVPEKYQNRNRQLQRQYKVGGYPTYVIVDVDGKTELGRLGAGRNKTPESFIKEAEEIVAKSSGGVSKFVTTLSPRDAANYRKYIDELKTAEAKLAEWTASEPAETEKNFATFYDQREAIQEIKDKIENIEVAQKARGMKPQDAKAYQQAHAELRTTKADLEEWMRTQPNRDEKNLKKLDAYERKIDKLSAIVERY
jgi:protein disulfide-isomerase